MSLNLLLAIAVLALDAWALDRVWRTLSPHRGRLRWTAAIVLLPIFGALLFLRQPRPVPETVAPTAELPPQ